MVAGDDLFTAESLRRKVSQLKQKAAGPNPSPLDKLLVARILLTRQRSSQHRYLAAVRALANVRNLLARAKPASGKAKSR